MSNAMKDAVRMTNLDEKSPYKETIHRIAKQKQVVIDNCISNCNGVTDFKNVFESLWYTFNACTMIYSEVCADDHVTDMSLMKFNTYYPGHVSIFKFREAYIQCKPVEELLKISEDLCNELLGDARIKSKYAEYLYKLI